MATGPLAGGMIFDALGSYTWLYIGSFGLGLGAFLIALTFRPFPMDIAETGLRKPLVRNRIPCEERFDRASDGGVGAEFREPADRSAGSSATSSWKSVPARCHWSRSKDAIMKTRP